MKDLYKAANRLHHLSMSYSGAIAELATGQQIFGIPQGHPGLHQTRDLIDLVLLCRAELNAMSKLLVEAKVYSEEQWHDAVVDEYEWLTDTKAKQFGFEVTDTGLRFVNPNYKP